MKVDLNLDEAAADDPPAPRGAMVRTKGLGRWLGQRASSSLTRRIVVLNLAGLVALLVGISLSQSVPPGPDRGAGLFA